MVQVRIAPSPPPKGDFTIYDLMSFHPLVFKSIPPNEDGLTLADKIHKNASPTRGFAGEHHCEHKFY